MKSCKRILLGLLLPALLLLAWWWATTYTDISHAILPSIPEVWRTLREFLADGTLAVFPHKPKKKKEDSPQQGTLPL